MEVFQDLFRGHWEEYNVEIDTEPLHFSRDNDKKANKKHLDISFFIMMDFVMKYEE